MLLGPRVFISYRRDDAYLGVSNVLDDIRAALIDLGCSSIFIDTLSIAPTHDWLERIYSEIIKADLVIALVGESWELLLNQKIANGGNDTLRRELALAFSTDRPVLQLGVGRARALRARDLPTDLRPLCRAQALQIALGIGSDHLSVLLKPILEMSVRSVRIRPLTHGIVVASLCTIYAATFLPWITGMSEYGLSLWMEFAFIWSGMFVWPVLFLPLVIVGLYRPICLMVDRAVAADSIQIRSMYLWPFALAFAITLSFLLVDLQTELAPWALRTDPLSTGRASAERELQACSPSLRYDLNGVVAARYAERGYTPEWLSSPGRCWPDIFLFLTLPQLDGISYKDTNPAVSTLKPIFLSIVRFHFEKYHLTFSNTFISYYISLFGMIYLLALSVSIAIFYLSVGYTAASTANKIRYGDLRDNYMLLAYAIITAMTWAIFRMPTQYYKEFAYGTVFAPRIVTDAIILSVEGGVLCAFVLQLLMRFNRRNASIVAFISGVCLVLLSLGAYRLARPMAQLGLGFQLAATIGLWLFLFAAWPSLSPERAKALEFLRRSRPDVPQ